MKALAVINSHYHRYFQALLHPELNRNGSMLTLNEAIVLSWPFIIVGVMTNTVFSIYLTVSFLDHNAMKSLPFISKGSLLTLPILWGTFWSLWGILFFPLRAYLYAFYIKVIIIFYQKFVGGHKADPQLAEDVISSAMSSNVFKLIPALGDVLQSLTQFVCLYKGLKSRMQINSLATFCILMTPALLLFLFLLGIIYSVFLLITY